MALSVPLHATGFFREPLGKGYAPNMGWALLEWVEYMQHIWVYVVNFILEQPLCARASAGRRIVKGKIGKAAPLPFLCLCL